MRAELRPPAIKGILRDWYRILVGAAAAVEAEARYFGGTGAGGGQSPFLLAIDRPLIGEVPWCPPGAHSDGIAGLRYLGYSLNFGENRRKAIAPGESFDLETVFPHGASEEHRRVLLSTVWLLAHLGGLGTRSRRGFGSLLLEDWQGPGGDGDMARLPLLGAAPDPASAGRYLRQGLEVLEQWFPTVARPEPQGREPGMRLTGARFLVVRRPGVGGAWELASEALEHVGGAMQRFRRQREIDGFPTARKLDRREHLPAAPARAAFGLPLSYRTRKSEYTFEPSVPGEGKAYRRFPSPLLLHVQRIRDGFVPIVSLLGGAWPGRDLPVRLEEVVEDRQGYRDFCPEDPGIRLPDALLDGLLAEGAEEVRL